MEKNEKIKDKKITIEDVAQYVGVGIATVSRAINNSDGISQKTKEKVLAAVEELGFVPNSFAQNMKVRRTMQIALAVPDIRNAFVPEVAYAVEQAAKQYGYCVIQINTLGNARSELELLKEIKKLHVDGLIILPLAYPKTLKEQINKANLPISIINYGKKLGDDIKADIVSMSTQEGKLVMQHLQQIGCTRIAYAGAMKNIIEERFFAYEDAIDHVDPALVYFGEDFSLETGIRAADHFYSLPQLPDAIYAGNDMVAIGLINRFKELGVSIPKEMAIVGIDNIWWGTVISPKLSTVSIMNTEVAKMATELLMQRIQEQKKGLYERVKFEPRLIVRESSIFKTQTTQKID